MQVQKCTNSFIFYIFCICILDPLFWSSVLDILKCKQPCGLKILQRQLTKNHPDIDNRLLLNMLREYPDRFTLQFGNQTNKILVKLEIKI